MRSRRSPWLGALLVGAALVGPTAAAAGGGGIGDSYNVILRSTLDQYEGTNDVWGYSGGGVELAIYGHRVGTSFVDATDPSNPVEVFNLAGPSSGWRDIKTYQNYAYIVTEGPGAGTGLQIVDLSNPLTPVFVGTYTFSNFTTSHNLWIDTATGIAYACGATGGGMHVLSLADPENPVQIDFFGQYYIHDLYVGNGRAYAGAISSGTLRILDVSTPSNPSTLATHTYSGAVTHNAWPTLDGNYVATSDETGGGHLKVWDIQNLSNIQLVSEYEIPGSIIHNALLRDDMCYISYYTAGTRLVDLTDPANPVEVGFYDTSDRGGGFDGNWGVYPFRSDDVIYSSDRQYGLYILEFVGQFAGDISGVVRDASSLAVLDSATVDVDRRVIFNTDGSGSYGGSLSGGTYDVVTTRFGYETDTTTVVVPANGAVTYDVSLNQVPSGTVTINLTELETGAPVAGAVARVLDSPIVNLVSDGTGKIDIPALPINQQWTVRIGKFGRELTDLQVTASVATSVVNAAIPKGFLDDFEEDQAWTFGAIDDDATDGLWEREIPVGSFIAGIVGPDEDATPFGAGYALVTESHVEGSFVGTSDVDGGKTTVLSPVFDGTGLGDLQLEYNRWFSNRAPSQSTDEFRADVSTDGGGSWTNVETVDFGTDSWVAVSIDLSAIVTPTNQMQLRFVAEDLSPNQYVEAGIDDVQIVSGATDTPILAGEVLRVGLAGAEPNPFWSHTEFAFDLPRTGQATLAVFDVSGRRVAELLAGARVAAGSYRIRWNGRDGAGERVAPGVYFAKLATAEGNWTTKVTLLR